MKKTNLSVLNDAIIENREIIEIPEILLEKAKESLLRMLKIN
jgi:hypothetical protein